MRCLDPIKSASPLYGGSLPLNILNSVLFGYSGPSLQMKVHLMLLLNSILLLLAAHHAKLRLGLIETRSHLCGAHADLSDAPRQLCLVGLPQHEGGVLTTTDDGREWLGLLEWGTTDTADDQIVHFSRSRQIGGIAEVLLLLRTIYPLRVLLTMKDCFVSRGNRSNGLAHDYSWSRGMDGPLGPPDSFLIVMILRLKRLLITVLGLSLILYDKAAIKKCR